MVFKGWFNGCIFYVYNMIIVIFLFSVLIRIFFKNSMVVFFLFNFGKIMLYVILDKNEF